MDKDYKDYKDFVERMHSFDDELEIDLNENQNDNKMINLDKANKKFKELYDEENDKVRKKKQIMYRRLKNE